MAASPAVRGVALGVVTHDRDLATVERHLDPAGFAAAWAEGRAMTLEQAVAYALDEQSFE